MRKFPLLSLFIVLLVALPLSSPGDTITLKSGEKIEGKVAAETDTALTVDVKISAGVTDTRTVLKSEVASIEKESADELAWQTLRGLSLGANSMPAAAYESNIKVLTAFITQFPASTHLADAQKTVDAMAKEKAQVEAGDVKLAGKWIAKENAQRERYQINASLAFNYMKDQSTRGELVPALNTFDAIEKQFPGARIFPDAVELSRRILTALNAEVTRRQQFLKTELSDREKGMKIASDADRLQMETAIKAEEAAANGIIAAAKSLKWPPLIGRSEKSLTALAAKIPPETQRLAAIDVSKQRQSLKLADEADEAVKKNDLAAAKEALKQAKTLWAANEIAIRLETETSKQPAVVAAVPAPEPPAPVATPAAAKRAAPVRNPATPAAAPVEEEKPFLLTAAGAITVVAVLIVVGLGVTAYRKIKRRANEALE